MKRRPIRIPNLGGAQAIILHRPHPTVQALTRQLTAIGLQVTQVWPELGPEALAADYIFFDADMGHDGQFPWDAGQPPMPMIALIGSEAPGRIEWSLKAGAHAQLLKPVGRQRGLFGAADRAGRLRCADGAVGRDRRPAAAAGRSADRGARGDAAGRAGQVRGRGLCAAASDGDGLADQFRGCGSADRGARRGGRMTDLSAADAPPQGALAPADAAQDWRCSAWC